jgi:dihydrofolate synthase/folylpolyglutamate synthase
MAQILAPHFFQIIITFSGMFKASDPEAVYRTFQGFWNPQGSWNPKGSLGGGALFYLTDHKAAIKKLLALQRETGLPALGTGSFYLAADIRNMAASLKQEAEL